MSARADVPSPDDLPLRDLGPLVPLKIRTAYGILRVLQQANPTAGADAFVKEVKSQLVTVNERFLGGTTSDVSVALADLDTAADLLLQEATNRRVRLPWGLLLELGMLSYTEGKFRRAETYMSKVLATAPKNREALAHRVELLILQDEIAEAEKAYRQLTQVDPHYLFEWLIGSPLDNLQKHEALLGFFDKLIAANPAEDGLKVNRCCVLIRVGQVKADVATIDRALGILEGLKERLGNDVMYLNTLAFGLLKRGRHGEAIRTAQRACALQEDNAPAHCIMGDCHAALSNYQEALREYTCLDVLASECASRCCKVLMKRADVLKKLGRRTEARDLYVRLSCYDVCTTRDVALVNLARDQLRERKEATASVQPGLVPQEHRPQGVGTLYFVAISLTCLVLAEVAAVLCCWFEVGPVGLTATVVLGVLGLFITLWLVAGKTETIKRLFAHGATIAILIILAVALSALVGYQVSSRSKLGSGSPAAKIQPDVPAKQPTEGG